MYLPVLIFISSLRDVLGISDYTKKRLAEAAALAVPVGVAGLWLRRNVFKSLDSVSSTPEEAQTLQRVHSPRKTVKPLVMLGSALIVISAVLAYFWYH